MRPMLAKSALVPGATAEKAAGRLEGTMARLLGARLPGFVLLALLFTVLPSRAVAQATDVTISTDYPSIVVQGGKQVKFPVRFTNNGTVDRELNVTIDGP